MSINLQAKSVAADMERIFRPIAGRTAAPLATGGAAGRPHRSRWLLIGAPVLVLLTGTGLGLAYIQDAWRPEMVGARAAVPAYRTAPPSDASTVTDITPEAVPLPEAPGGSFAAGQVDGPAALPSTEASDVPAPPARADRATGDRYAERDADEPSRSVEPSERVTRTVPVRRTGSRLSSASDCPPNSPEDRCIYQDVLDADARLRRAFDRARRDGVANGDLATITRQWRQARDRATDDPDGTIRRYDRLAGALEDMRQETGE